MGSHPKDTEQSGALSPVQQGGSVRSSNPTSPWESSSELPFSPFFPPASCQEPHPQWHTLALWPVPGLEERKAAFPPVGRGKEGLSSIPGRKHSPELPQHPLGIGHLLLPPKLLLLRGAGTSWDCPLGISAGERRNPGELTTKLCAEEFNLLLGPDLTAPSASPRRWADWALESRLETSNPLWPGPVWAPSACTPSSEHRQLH